MGLGKFVGAVNISVAMNLEDLGISQDLEILAQTPRKKGFGTGLGADQWQIEQRRKVSEITFDPRLDGTHLATLIKSFEPGKKKEKENCKNTKKHLLHFPF